MKELIVGNIININIISCIYLIIMGVCTLSTIAIRDYKDARAWKKIKEMETEYKNIWDRTL